jgi:hypothetical protein
VLFNTRSSFSSLFVIMDQIATFAGLSALCRTTRGETCMARSPLIAGGAALFAFLGVDLPIARHYHPAPDGGQRRLLLVALDMLRAQRCLKVRPRRRRADHH